MRVLVTGASGYVGGRLAAELHARGVKVLAAVRRERPWLSEHEQRVADLVRDELGPLCSGVDAVVHLAGPNDVQSAADPNGTMATTVVGTRRLAEAARSAGVERFCYLSTVQVYGAALVAGARVDEQVVPEPRNAYSIGRLASEHSSRSEIDAVVLRLTNVVGAPVHQGVDRWSLVASDLCRQAVESGVLRLRSDGSQWRDFIPLTDVCRIVADIACDGIEPGTYNLGSGGDPITIRQMAEKIRTLAGDILGTEPELVAPAMTGSRTDPFTIVTDKLADLGVTARSSIDQEIEEMLRLCVKWKG